MTRYIILTQRPIEGILEIAKHLWHMPEIMFKVNARIIKVDGDHDDIRPIQMFVHLASMFGMYAYLYDPFGVVSLETMANVTSDTYNYDGIVYYLGGTCHANVEQASASNNFHITYGRVLNMKNGFSQILEYDCYKYIRFYSADGRSTTTIMDVDSYLTNLYLKNTFESLFGVSPTVVNFTPVPSLPAPTVGI